MPQFFGGNEYLEPVKEECLIIEACDGTELLSDSKLFWGINHDYKHDMYRTPPLPPLCSDPMIKGAATIRTEVRKYRLIKRIREMDLVESINLPYEKLCLTQHQIKTFAETYANKIRKKKNIEPEYTFLYMPKELFSISISDSHIGEPTDHLYCCISLLLKKEEDLPMVVSKNDPRFFILPWF